jgi:hypothetical protein
MRHIFIVLLQLMELWLFLTAPYRAIFLQSQAAVQAADLTMVVAVERVGFFILPQPALPATHLQSQLARVARAQIQNHLSMEITHR